MVYCIWASSRENLSSGFPTKRDLTSFLRYRDKLGNRNLAGSKLKYGAFKKVNNKGAGQTAWMHRLVCAFVVRKARNTGFLATRPIYKGVTSYNFQNILYIHL